MNAQDPDTLGRALAKQAEGRGTSNSEKRALSDYSRGKIGRDHFASIATTPVRDPRPLWQQSSKNPHLAIENVDGLQAALRKGGSGSGGGSADLVTLVSAAGGTFEEFTICVSGSPATRWLPTWTADPS